MIADDLFEAALALVESDSIRAWATTPNNRPVWVGIAQRKLDKGAVDPVAFATYITLTAMGA